MLSGLTTVLLLVLHVLGASASHLHIKIHPHISRHDVRRIKQWMHHHYAHHSASAQRHLASLRKHAHLHLSHLHHVAMHHLQHLKHLAHHTSLRRKVVHHVVVHRIVHHIVHHYVHHIHHHVHHHYHHYYTHKTIKHVHVHVYKRPQSTMLPATTSPAPRYGTSEPPQQFPTLSHGAVVTPTMPRRSTHLYVRNGTNGQRTLHVVHHHYHHFYHHHYYHRRPYARQSSLNAGGNQGDDSFEDRQIEQQKTLMLVLLLLSCVMCAILLFTITLVRQRRSRVAMRHQLAIQQGIEMRPKKGPVRVPSQDECDAAPPQEEPIVAVTVQREGNNTVAV